MVTDFTTEAQDLLRDPTQFKWYAVTLLVLVMYVYSVEVERRRWDILLAGVTLWLADWINEIANSLVLHFTDRAAIWTTTGDTAYLILIGLTLEISLMFAISGIVFAKSLPEDKKQRLLGLPNRLTIALAFSVLAVVVELLLHATGYFHWEYWWWNTSFVLPILVFGYLWFFLIAAYVYDLPDNRRRLRVVGVMAAIVAASLVAFGPLLNWI
ncbi:MAG: hypothetical protein JJE10_03265 [Thermoleophilia bacterium]|nr:hypothetical protein [Thermoleophilia bacterium]